MQAGNHYKTVLMDLRRKKAIIFFIFTLLTIASYMSHAQDYYNGGGNNDSWRKKPAENKQPNDLKNTTDPSGYTSINAGFANPVGSFGNPVGNGYGGYALPGFDFDFSFSVPINHSNFGLAFMLGSYSNTYDLNNYINYLNNTSPIYGFGSLQQSVNNIYSETSILGGFYTTYPIGRLSIDGRLMIGALLNTLPEQAYGQENINTGDIWEYDLQNSYPTSFAVDAGIGLRFMVFKLAGRQVCLMANVDYLYSEVYYNATQLEATQAANQTSPTYYQNTITGHLPVSLVNFTFGIGYQFGGGE